LWRLTLLRQLIWLQPPNGIESQSTRVCLMPPSGIVEGEGAAAAPPIAPQLKPTFSAFLTRPRLYWPDIYRAMLICGAAS
jgi:hypothetical protein